MSDHSMLGGARTGGEFHAGPVVLDAGERDKVRQMLSLEGLIWLPAGTIWQSPGGIDGN
jgi:hypothetical protein